MKSRILSVTIIFVLVFGLFPTASIAAGKPSLNKNVVVLDQGKHFSLKVRNSGRKKVKWSTNKKTIATVSSKGVVTGVALGGAQITAKVGSKKLSCRVVVTSEAEKKIIEGYGIIPKELWKSPTKLITSKEFCNVITNIIKKKDTSLVSKWKEVAKKALLSKNKVAADEALLAMYEAILIMGIEYEPGTGEGRGEPDWESECRTNYGFNGKDWWIGRTWNFLFDNAHNKILTPWGMNEEICMNALWYFEKHHSVKDNSYAVAPTDNYRAEFSPKLTRAEAIHVLRVFAECDSTILDHQTKYIKPEEVGAYDETIITPELLSKETSLPEATQAKLPSTWKGIGLSHRQDAMHGFVPICESDIIILHDNGLNFTRYFFDFTKLRYPYTYTDKTDINEYELKRLDQTLAWCIKHDVHLCISCLGFGGYSSQGEYTMQEAPLSEWESFKADWAALARRYKGISSRYLSFDLMNEFVSNSPQEEYDNFFADAARGIWAEDPERVVIKSYGSWQEIRNVEKLASQGIAVDMHPYMPRFLTDYNPDSVFRVPDKWPIPCYRASMRPFEPLTISGNIGGMTLTLFVDGCEAGASLDVMIDGKKYTTITPVGDAINEQGDYENNIKPCSVKLPASASKIELILSTDGSWLRTRLMRLENGKETYEIAALDSEGEEYAPSAAPSDVVFDGKKFSCKDGFILDAETVYEQAIKPSRDIAEKYGVGFAICECGVFGESDLGDIAYQYIDDMLGMFERHGLGWCYCEAELFGLSRLTNYFSQKSSPIDVIKYTDNGGYQLRYYADRNMLATLRKHT